MASDSAETLALGPEDEWAPGRRFSLPSSPSSLGGWALVVLGLVAVAATLWPHLHPQPSARPLPPAVDAALRYRGVELVLPTRWLRPGTANCPTVDTAGVAPLRDLHDANGCPKGHRGTVVLLAPYDTARPPEVSGGRQQTQDADGRTYAQRLVPERGVAVSIATDDSAAVNRVLASMRILRQGDIVDGCPAAALKLPVARASFATVDADPTAVRGATLCAYAGAWLGAVTTLDAARAVRLMRNISAGGPPPARTPCREQDLTGTSTHNWLAYLDTTPGTTALLVLQRCVGEPGGAVLITGEPSRAASQALWRDLVSASPDNGVTPTYP